MACKMPASSDGRVRNGEWPPSISYVAVARVGLLVAPHLGWDPQAQVREIQHYRARVEAERDSQHQTTDRTADAARMGAPDVRTGRSEWVRAASPCR